MCLKYAQSPSCVIYDNSVCLILDFLGLQLFPIEDGVICVDINWN